MRNTLLVLTMAATLAAQNPISLATWTVEDYGTLGGIWTLAANGLSVTQSANSWQTVFYSDFDLGYMRVEGQVSVGAADDDYFGFALGFHPGDATNPNADYLLLDWKRTTQVYDFPSPACTPGSTARVGLALSRVEGIPTADEFWGHVDLNTAPCSTPTDKVTELQRAFTRGSTGWAPNRVYTFRIDYLPDLVRVHVDGVLEIDLAGTFGDGRMAFYSHSQPGVTYSAFTSTSIAAWSNYGAGYPGTAGTPALASSSAPVLGAQIDVLMTSAAASPAVAALGFGLGAASASTGYGGVRLVDLISLEVLVAPVAPAQALRPLGIPSHPTFCGLEIFLQFVHLDAGATHGLAFSPGLALRLGN